MFQWSKQIGVICSRESCCVLRVSIDNHRLVYCEVFCIWRYVNRRSASGIQSEITTFRKSSLFFFFFALLFIFGGQKIFVVSCVVGFYRSQSQHTATQASQALAKVQHVWLCCQLAGFCCECCDRLWSLVSIHREASRAVVRLAKTCMVLGCSK